MIEFTLILEPVYAGLQGRERCDGCGVFRDRRRLDDHRENGIMKLIVHLQATARQVDAGGYWTVHVFEFQTIERQVDDFNRLAIDQRQAETFEIQGEVESGSDFLLNCFKGLLATQTVLADRQSVSTSGFVQTNIRIIVGDPDDLLARFCAYIQRHSTWPVASLLMYQNQPSLQQSSTKTRTGNLNGIRSPISITSITRR